MKNNVLAVGLFTLAVLLSAPVPVCRAQIIVGGATSQSATPLASVPATGTFFSATLNLPPWPADWLPQVPVYVQDASNNIFIVDDRGWDYSASGNAIFAATAQSGGMGAMADGVPVPPTNGWTSNDGSGGGPSMPLPLYSAADLYLTNFAVSGTTNTMVIHAPAGFTNGVYNLLYTTNLSPPISWRWLMTTAPGQTNLTVTNATDPQRFYGLGGTNSSAGTDFWVAFCNVSEYEYYNNFNFSLYISSPVAASGTVSVPGLGITSNFTLAPGAVTNISLRQDAIMTNYAVITTNGVHITSSAPVSVYPVSYVEQASSAFTGYPTAMLGTNYCLLALPSNDGGCASQFAIVATADDTTVTVTPTRTNDPSAPPGINFTNITLQQGQTYQMCSSNYWNDVTGTWINSDKPVVVYSGANDVELNGTCANPIQLEQFPVASWGNQVLALSFGWRTGGDSFRVLTASTNTALWTNGVIATTLQPGVPYDMILEGGVVFQGSNPIQVAQFANGYSFDSPPNSDGDPTGILLPPTGHYLTSYAFASPTNVPVNYLNLIVPNSAILTTLMDGTNIPAGKFVQIVGSGYSGAQVSVAAGPHTVSSSQPVGVEVYGFGFDDAYGYIGGVLSYP